PEDRYPTPRGLSDDIERWAADEPVSAWREPLTWRARGGARGDRAAVPVAIAGVGIAVLAVVLRVQTRANRDVRGGHPHRQRGVGPHPESDPNVPHRRQRGPAPGPEGVQGAARQASHIGTRFLWRARTALEGSIRPRVAQGARSGVRRGRRTDFQDRFQERRA